MNRPHSWLLSFFLGTLAAGPAYAAAAAESPQPTVRIDSGKIAGVALGQKKDVDAYKGIPFAAAPVGELRWKPPQAVKAWDGVRDCTKFGLACPQPKVPIISDDITQLGEDCLNLNVYTPAKTGGHALPVMVWIHGGAYAIGANYQNWYNGESLARKGVVVVTINYRLGLFGFLAHPLLSKESEHGVSGNYGLLDQIAALEWVKRNIAAFGGDPNCVTVFGESAGAGSVCHLLVSPLTVGLFQRAIAESGGARGPTRHLREKWYGREPAEAVGTYIASELGCDRDEHPLAAMRKKAADEIIQAAASAKAHFGDEVCWPIVDGWLVPDEPALLFDDGKAHDVPFLTGSNRDEIGGILSEPVVRALYRERADAVLKLFPDEARNRAGTVAVFTSVARADARAMSRHKSKAYLYQFSRAAAPWRFLGAFHASEVPFVFGNFDSKLAFERRDRELSQTMMDFWVQFAKTGDPNGRGLPEWPTYNALTDRHLELGSVVQAGTGLDKTACDGLDRINAERVRTRKNESF